LWKQAQENMMTATIIIGFLLVLLVGFLFTPITLYIDTNEGRFEIFQRPVLRFMVTFQDVTPFPRFQLLGVDVPLRRGKGKPKVKPRKVKSALNFRKSISAWKDLLLEILSSFRIKSGVIDVDPDDVVLHAQLVPVFMALSRESVHFRTNFAGHVYFHLEICTKPVRVLWIFFRFLTKK
jgi:hypothetical protein